MKTPGEVLLMLAGSGPGNSQAGESFTSIGSSYVGTDGRPLQFGKTGAVVRVSRTEGLKETVLDGLPSVAVQSPSDPTDWLDATGRLPLTQRPCCFGF